MSAAGTLVKIGLQVLLFYSLSAAVGAAVSIVSPIGSCDRRDGYDAVVLSCLDAVQLLVSRFAF